MLDILFASASQPGGQAAGNPIMGFLPFIAMILIMYFLIIMPQKKKQKDKQNMLNNLKTGDEILTIGGLYAKIEGINEKDNKLIVSIGKDMKVTIARSAIADKINKQ